MAKVTLVVPLYRDAHVKLSGDGRFTVGVGQHLNTFKPVSVQCMWATIQKLHEAIEIANLQNYYHGGLSHTWIPYYQSRLTTDRHLLNNWAYSEDLAPRIDSPGLGRSNDREDPLKKSIIQTLRTVMQGVDLELATSKEIRSLCESNLDRNLKDFRGFIDQQMLVIMGQMEQPSEIFDFLYLGSEWNASNFKEMQEKGINYVLNVTCEIDNFFPDYLHYYNVRVWDTPDTELLKHWDDTYQFIKKAQANNSKVLVHCKMGVSRSASTVIAFAMKEYKWQLKEAMEFVKSKRDCVNPNVGFVQQLRQYEGILGARHNPVWGEKATLRKRVSEIPGPVPPRGASPDEDMDIVGDEAEDEGEGARPFVRTPSISRLLGSGQRPKSWAGVKPEDAKREVEVMKEQNMSLYFQSLMTEKQQCPEDSITATAGAGSCSAKQSTLLPATRSSSAHAAMASSSAEGATARPPRHGHRRAKVAKSLDLSSRASQQRHGFGVLGSTAQDSHQLPMARSLSPEEASHTPVADRQPTAQQIELAVNQGLSRDFRLDAATDASSTFRTSSGESNSPTTSVEDSPLHPCLSGTNPVPASVSSVGAATTSTSTVVPRVRDQVASFESRRMSLTMTVSPSGTLSEVPETVSVTGAENDDVMPDPVDDVAEASSSAMSVIPASGDTLVTISPPSLATSPPLPTLTMATECESTSSAITCIERPSSASSRQPLVEKRPQISSVHRRVQSIENFQALSPSDVVAGRAQQRTADSGSQPGVGSEQSAEGDDAVALSSSPLSVQRSAVQQSDEIVQRSTSPMLQGVTQPSENDNNEAKSNPTIAVSNDSSTSAMKTSEVEPSDGVFSSFGGFSSTGGDSHTPQSNIARLSPKPVKASVRSGTRAMSISNATGRRPRAGHNPYQWQGKKMGESSPTVLRRFEVHSRGSPTRHRSLSFISPRSQRRGHSTSEENFVTYIPSRRTSSETSKPVANFQSLLEQFRGMSKPPAKTSSDGGDGDNPPASSSSPSQSTIDGSIPAITTAMEA